MGISKFLRVPGLGLFLLGAALSMSAACGGANGSHAKDAAAGADGSDAGAADADAPDRAEINADIDASDDASTDVADAMLEAPPPFDAGAGCASPTGEAPLVPVTEGVPATGLVLWLRGDRGVYKTPTNDVCGWADQSGHPTVLTPSSTRPTWAATGLGGQAAVHYTATEQSLATSGVLGIAATSARTFVAVTALVTPALRFSGIVQGQANSPGTYLGLDANTFNTAGNREGVYAMNNAYDAVIATSTAARVHVYTMGVTGPLTIGTPVLPALDYRVNGAPQTLTRTAGGLGDGNWEDFSGANSTVVGTSAADVYISEVLIYDRALSTSERAAVEAALMARYAIQK